MKIEEEEGRYRVSTKAKGVLGWVTETPEGKWFYDVSRKQTRGGEHPLFETKDEAIKELMEDA